MQCGALDDGGIFQSWRTKVFKPASLESWLHISMVRLDKAKVWFALVTLSTWVVQDNDLLIVTPRFLALLTCLGCPWMECREAKLDVTSVVRDCEITSHFS